MTACLQVGDEHGDVRKRTAAAGQGSIHEGGVNTLSKFLVTTLPQKLKTLLSRMRHENC